MVFSPIRNFEDDEGRTTSTKKLGAVLSDFHRHLFAVIPVANCDLEASALAAW